MDSELRALEQAAQFDPEAAQRYALALDRSGLVLDLKKLTSRLTLAQIGLFVGDSPMWKHMETRKDTWPNQFETNYQAWQAASSYTMLYILSLADHGYSPRLKMVCAALLEDALEKLELGETVRARLARGALVKTVRILRALASEGLLENLDIERHELRKLTRIREDQPEARTSEDFIIESLYRAIHAAMARTDASECLTIPHFLSDAYCEEYRLKLSAARTARGFSVPGLAPEEVVKMNLLRDRCLEQFNRIQAEIIRSVVPVPWRVSPYAGGFRHG